MLVYRLAKQLLEEVWPDAEELAQHPMTIKVSGQLYAAIGSIEANIGEGYSRSSGKDRCRIYEYALGSVRESVTWYRAGKPILGQELVAKTLESTGRTPQTLIDDYSKRARPSDPAQP
jgi:four helix bundle protein